MNSSRFFISVFALLLFYCCNEVGSGKHVLGQSLNDNRIDRFYDQCLDSSVKHDKSCIIFGTRHTCMPCYKHGYKILDSFIWVTEAFDWKVYDISEFDLKNYQSDVIEKKNVLCSIENYPISFSDFNLIVKNQQDSLVIYSYGLKDIGKFMEDVEIIFQSVIEND